MQLAGGSLPDVFTVPFTDAKTLLENDQLMDVTEEMEELGYTDSFNPIILDARHRRRRAHLRLPAPGLRERALVQPRAVRSGRSRPRQPADDVGRGARVRQADHRRDRQGRLLADGDQQHRRLAADRGDRRARRPHADRQRATARPSRRSTTTRRRRRCSSCTTCKWEDDSFGSKVDLDWGTINQEFAAGNIGMYTTGSDIYTALVRDFGLDPDVYGMTVIPLEGDEPGPLGGGDIAVMSPTIDDETKAAGVKWIDWYYMQKLLDEDAAVARREDAEPSPTRRSARRCCRC